MISIPKLFHTKRESYLDASPIRVVIADDHPIVRKGLIQELSCELNVTIVGEVADGDSVLSCVQDLTPDVLVVDIKMQCLNVSTIMYQIASLSPSPNVLILTDSVNLEQVLEATQHGVRGYLLKSEPASIVSQAVLTVARGETCMSDAVIHQLIEYALQRHQASLQLSRPSFHAESSLPDLPLSLREQEVLHLLAEGLENQEIGELLCISERTVRFHLRNIYDKIGLRRRSEAIAWSVRQGFGQISDDNIGEMLC